MECGVVLKINRKSQKQSENREEIRRLDRNQSQIQD